MQENIEQANNISELKTEVNGLKHEIQLLKKQNDDHEQHSRNDCLVLHGLPETGPDERENTDAVVCDTVNKLLGVDLTPNDIKRSHRLGPVKPQKIETRATKQTTRPIIFKLQHFNKRKEIFSMKKKLKGKGIMITENLTRYRYDLYKKAVQKFGVKAVWSLEGRITVKLNGERKSFTTIEELESL